MTLLPLPLLFAEPNLPARRGQDHFACINTIHQEQGFDLPCREPTTKVAFMLAIRRVGELVVRPSPERRAPVHPRFIVKMIDLATNHADEIIRRACVFTALSYACMGRRGVNVSVPLADLVVEKDGMVSGEE